MFAFICVRVDSEKMLREQISLISVNVGCTLGGGRFCSLIALGCKFFYFFTFLRVPGCTYSYLLD